MGRRLNLPTPTVINTELIPLDESFYIEASGQLEQWYYDNTSQFAPNRRLAPLTLTPHISVFDGDTATSYTPSFYTVRWYENAYNASSGTYVETEIVNQTDSATADYVKSGNNLIVKKNVSYTRGVTIRCEATYIDPRDAGVTYVTGDSVVLSTNRDATVMYPKLDVLAPSAQSFNPLIDNSSQFQFKAVADATGIEMESVEQYRVDVGGTEQMLPENDTTVETCSPKLTIDYDGITQEDQVFTLRQTGGGSVPQPVSDTAKLMSVKGNTIKWNQIVLNGNFSDSTTGWSKWVNGVTGNQSVSNGEITMTKTAGSSSYALTNSGFVADITHKFYVSCYAKSSDGVYAQIGFSVYDGTDGGQPKLYTTSDTYVNLKGILQGITSNSDAKFTIRCASGNYRGSVSFKKIIVIDLTAIFGAGNEPSTVADFEAWLDANIGLKDYYPYDAGSLIPVKSTALKSVGFNLIRSLPKRNASKGYNVRLFNGVSYRLHAYNISSVFRWAFKLYDISKNEITAIGAAKTILGTDYIFYRATDGVFVGSSDTSARAHGTLSLNITKDCLFEPLINTVGTYENPCFNVSTDPRDGTYQAYWEDNVRLDITGITGINPTTGVREAVFPTGMKAADTVYDEIYVENGAVKAIKRVGSADLGKRTYKMISNQNFWYSLLSNAKGSTGATGKGRAVNVKYPTVTNETVSFRDKTLALGSYYTGGSNIYIHDETFSSGTSLAESLQGVMLYYQLTTPVVYTDLKFADGSPVTASTVFEWYGISNNTEVKADTLPWYVSGQNTSTLTVDAMYGETIRVILRAKANTAATTLFPDKVYRTVEWRVPDIDTHVLSENGSAVRSSTNDMSFDTVINVMHAILSDEKKSAHLRFNWKTRKNNVSTEVDAGWGQTTTMDALDLRNTRGSSNSQLASTLVFPYVYLMGAYEKCTQGGEEITENGETVFDRPVL